MKNKITGFIALLLLIGSSWMGQSQVVEAHYVAGCDHWYLADGEYTSGMAFSCTTAAAGNYNALQIKCSNGQYLTTAWIPQTSSLSYGKICPGSYVVDQHWIYYATF